MQSQINIEQFLEQIQKNLLHEESEITNEQLIKIVLKSLPLQSSTINIEQQFEGLPPPEDQEIILEKIFDNLHKKLPEFVTRKKLREETGGLISEKTLANLDSEGTGIQPRIRIGGKVAYPKEAAINWLKQRCDFF